MQQSRRVGSPIRIRAVGLVALVSLVLACSALTSATVAGAASSTEPAPKLKDPEATARKLITAWLTALKEQDSKEIAASLAPNFQIERADGSGQNRAEYIAKPATVSSFTLGDDFVAFQSGETLTARWSTKISEQIGDNQFRDVEAPRLTTFVWRKGRWQILSYANFNPPPVQ